VEKELFFDSSPAIAAVATLRSPRRGRGIFVGRLPGAVAILQLGFAIVEVPDAWKFAYIHALKTERAPLPDVGLNF
jgi:hypothetical protein